MSQEPANRGDNPDFFQMADAFINKGNELLKNHKPSQVSASLLYAAARYNSFAYSLTYPDAVTFEKDKPMIINELVGQYQSMLQENLAYYVEQVKADGESK